MPIKKQTLDDFQNYLLQQYQTHCWQHNYPFKIDNFIAYLIDEELISDKAIKNFTIANEFHQLYPEKCSHKTKTILQLVEKYKVSERYVWGLLKQQKREI